MNKAISFSLPLQDTCSSHSCSACHLLTPPRALSPELLLRQAVSSLRVCKELSLPRGRTFVLIEFPAAPAGLFFQPAQVPPKSSPTLTHINRTLSTGSSANLAEAHTLASSAAMLVLLDTADPWTDLCGTQSMTCNYYPLSPAVQPAVCNCLAGFPYRLLGPNSVRKYCGSQCKASFLTQNDIHCFPFIYKSSRFITEGNCFGEVGFTLVKSMLTVHNDFPLLHVSRNAFQCNSVIFPVKRSEAGLSFRAQPLPFPGVGDLP